MKACQQRSACFEGGLNCVCSPVKINRNVQQKCKRQWIMLVNQCLIITCIHCFAIYVQRKFLFLHCSWMPSVFQFLLLSSCSVIDHHSEVSLSTFLTSTPTRNLYTYVISHDLFSLQAEQCCLSHPLYIAHMLQYLHHLCGSLRDLFHCVQVLLIPGSSRRGSAFPM